MAGSSSRKPLVTSVAIKRPLTTGFRVLLSFVIVLAIAAAGVAWHSERQHKRAKHSVRSLDTELDQVQAQLAALKSSEAARDEKLREQQAVLDRLLASGPELRQRWLADRIGAAVASAEQALALDRHVAGAQAALGAADRLLAGQPDAALLPLRRALQQDLSMLSTLDGVDVPGIYLRLQAIDRRIAELDLPREAGRAEGRRVADATPREQTAAAEDLWARGLAKFRSLIVIRQYDQPLQPLLDDARRQLVRDQLSLVLEQARMALLRGDGVLYRAALESLSLKLQRDFAALPNQVIGPLLDELADLQALRIQFDVPPLASRAALDALPLYTGAAL